MLKYLVIQLSEDAVSYCHFDNQNSDSTLIPVNELQNAILFGMKENLNIQFVYPKQSMPTEYNKVIESIDHIKIKPYNASENTDADIIVFDDVDDFISGQWLTHQICIVRITRAQISNIVDIYRSAKGKTPRVNIVIKDIDKFTEGDFDLYKSVLSQLNVIVEEDTTTGTNIQINLLTDRLVMNGMNNCNAGDEVITIMPNGHFYPCAGFYYDNPSEHFGTLETGIEIKNRQLYKMSHAPICRNCDAYQCRRCVWLNRKTTLEVNTPSHEQCVIAHLERNASRELILNIRKHGEFMPEIDIKEITYLDPFDIRNKW